MTSIDEIISYLDWNNTEYIQEQGRIMARDVECINAFIQPVFSNYGKNVWDNCALILSEKDDKKLVVYINRLLEWVSDLNWPGADCIFSRLCRFERSSIFEDALNNSIKIARITDDEQWYNSLIKLKKQYLSVDIHRALYEMSCDKSPENQERGIETAKKINYLPILIKPAEWRLSWENCAKVLASKSNEELEGCYFHLLFWLKKMTDSGAELIFKRLIRVESEYLNTAFQIAYSTAKQNQDSEWIENLTAFSVEHKEPLLIN